jgi:GTP-binding protein Era
VICAVNKCDRLDTPKTAAVLSQVAELEIVDEIFPISARTGEGLDALIEQLAAGMPESPYLYPPEDRSDAPGETHLAELIREQILRRTHEEVPHAVEVFVDSLELRDDGLFEVKAQVWAETESQKAILIGKGGRMVRDVGSAARQELERELGGRVYLDLQVRVREKWRRDDGLLDRLGIE